MPAKPLSLEQIQDAARFKQAFGCWSLARKEIGEKGTQEAAAGILEISQASFNDYGRGKIPLNVEILAKSMELLAFNPRFISPSLYGEMEKLARLIGYVPTPKNAPDPNFPLIRTRNDQMSKDVEMLLSAIQASEVLTRMGAKIPEILVSTDDVIKKNQTRKID